MAIFRQSSNPSELCNHALNFKAGLIFNLLTLSFLKEHDGHYCFLHVHNHSKYPFYNDITVMPYYEFGIVL